MVLSPDHPAAILLEKRRAEMEEASKLYQEALRGYNTAALKILLKTRSSNGQSFPGNS